MEWSVRTLKSGCSASASGRPIVIKPAKRRCGVTVKISRTVATHSSGSMPLLAVHRFHMARTVISCRVRARAHHVPIEHQQHQQQHHAHSSPLVLIWTMNRNGSARSTVCAALSSDAASFTESMVSTMKRFGISAATAHEQRYMSKREREMQPRYRGVLHDRTGKLFALVRLQMSNEMPLDRSRQLVIHAVEQVFHVNERRNERERRCDAHVRRQPCSRAPARSSHRIERGRHRDTPVSARPAWSYSPPRVPAAAESTQSVSQREGAPRARAAIEGDARASRAPARASARRSIAEPGADWPPRRRQSPHRRS